MVYSEDQPLAVREDILEGQSYIANGETKVVYSEHLRRLSATVNKYRARLLTIMVPFHQESELPAPAVTFDRATETLTCRLTFPSGASDTLTFNATDVQFARTTGRP